MRKIIVSVATSAGGHIARPDGSVEWLDRPRTAGDYGMAFYRSIDTILWGWKTYDVAIGFQRQGVKGAAFDPKVMNYVFSREEHTPAPRVEVRQPTVPRTTARSRTSCSSMRHDSMPETGRASATSSHQTPLRCWTATVNGRDRITAFFRDEMKGFAAQGVTVTLAMKVLNSGPFAFARAVFMPTLRKGGNQTTAQVRFLVVFEKSTDGVWRVARLMTNGLGGTPGM